jgi:hypothetical protein
VLEREHACRCRVVELDEREIAAAVTDDRELPFARRIDEPVIRRSVEAAVAERDSAGDDGAIVKVVHCRPSLDRACHRLGVERIVLTS